MIGFLRRLIRASARKLFLIVDGDSARRDRQAGSIRIFDCMPGAARLKTEPI
jgi:hypothetical protein